MTIELHADCGRCAGLCCVGLAFDQSEDFAIDKPAGVPCPHLDQGSVCRIHAALEEDGFAGCVRYDCDGAGQRVVQEVFKGQSWHDDPTLLEPMLDAFRMMRDMHQLLALLETSGRIDLPDTLGARRQLLIDATQPEDGWDEAALTVWDRGPWRKDVADYLVALRPLV